MDIIEVKESAPFNLASGSPSCWGRDYMVRISAKTARQLAGMYPVPHMGYEIVVGIAPCQFGLSPHRLTLQNLSGDFYLACSSRKVEEWPEVFRVQVTRAPAGGE